jgi:hypothetical protein
MTISVLAILALFEVGRGVFSSVYGCSVMYQLKTRPSFTKPKVLSFLKQDEILYDIVQTCLFDNDENHTENFYSLFKTPQTKDSLSQMLGFLDGIKMLHEEFSILKYQYDTTFTSTMIETLEDYKSGEKYDYLDIHHRLHDLNDNYHCSEIFFSVNVSNCQSLPENKTRCINIQENNFENDPCVKKQSESETLFNNLKTSMKDESQYMEEVLYQLDGKNNPYSIMSLINKALLEFKTIDQKVRAFDTELNTHFENLSQGPLETWLDCGVIQDEMAKSFNNICDSKLEDLTNFVNLNLAIIIICYGAINIFFVITFCLKDIDDIKEEQEGNEDEDKEGTGDEQEYQMMSEKNQIEITGKDKEQDVEQVDFLNSGKSDPNLKGF